MSVSVFNAPGLITSLGIEVGSASEYPTSSAHLEILILYTFSRRTTHQLNLKTVNDTVIKATWDIFNYMDNKLLRINVMKYMHCCNCHCYWLEIYYRWIMNQHINLAIQAWKRIMKQQNVTRRFSSWKCLALCLLYDLENIGFIYPAMSMIVIGHSLLY
jgi:hypothetical protein